jgi:ribosomal protein L44E
MCAKIFFPQKSGAKQTNKLINGMYSCTTCGKNEMGLPRVLHFRLVGV